MTDTIHIRDDDNRTHIARTDTNGAVMLETLCDQRIDADTWHVGEGGAKPCLACVRHLHGMTLAEVADETGYSVSYLGDIERRRRRLTPKVRRKLEGVYGEEI